MSRAAPTDYFQTTRWTVVLAAGNNHTRQADVALESLCKAYWFPLYAYVRRHTSSREDAEDLTQAFFARFLAKNYLDGLCAERGRFRVRDELPEGVIQGHVLCGRAVAFPLDRAGSRSFGRRIGPHPPRVAVARAAGLDCRMTRAPYWSDSAIRMASSRPNEVSIR